MLRLVACENLIPTTTSELSLQCVSLAAASCTPPAQTRHPLEALLGIASGMLVAAILALMRGCNASYCRNITGCKAFQCIKSHVDGWLL